MPIASLDPNLIHPTNSGGRAIEPLPDAMDMIISKVNEVINNGSVGTKQTFRVSRQAGDTDTIIINAARGFLARTSTSYNVFATMGANSLGVAVQGIDPATFTTSQFTLKLTSAWAAGDSIMFIVEDLT